MTRAIPSGARPRSAPATSVGLLLVALAALVYWLGNRDFDAGRGDFFHLADAFLHGRTWLDFQPGVWDYISGGPGRFYVPFAPLPAIAFMPLVAAIGPVAADQIESGINAVLAATSVGLCWVLVGRIGVRRLVDRLWLTVLFGFSTVIWWITTRGGVWHSGQLIATILTFLCLVELWGARRAAVVGLLAGAAFLTRAPLAFAVPFYLLLLASPADDETERAGGSVWPASSSARTALARPALSSRPSWPVRDWVVLLVATLPAVAFFLWYNVVRFGTPFESGYALATLPDWLEARRRVGLFSLAHVPMNLELLLLHAPARIAEPPYFRPDGHGLSILFTSPGLLLAALAPWRRSRARWLLGAAVAVLIPTLLYYGGGWLQYGYRYALDSIPFVVALAALAVARRGRVGLPWVLLIALGVIVNLFGVYWAYRL